MKKVLILTLMAAASLSAAQLVCGSGSQSIVNPPASGTFFCGAVTNPSSLFAITNISLGGSATFSNPTAANNFTFDVLISINSPQVSLNGAVNFVNSTSGTLSFLTNSQSLSAGTSLSAFTVTLLRSGSPLPSITTAEVFLNYDITPASQIPEPGTMALLGSSLVGLAALARRRK